MVSLSPSYIFLLQCLPPDHFQQMLGIAGTLHINLRNRAFDIAQIGGRQLDARAPDILSQPALLRRARDRGVHGPNNRRR
jgi:hypothetical protein